MSIPLPRLSLAFAAAGAVLFAASLGYGIYFYAVVLARTAPTWSGTAAAVDGILFSLFALHHSILARTRVKVGLTRILPPALERSTYVWLASLLFLVVCVGWRPVGGLPLFEVSPPLAWLLEAVQFGGVLLTLASIRRFDLFEFVGVRQVLPARASPGYALSNQGPYGLVRHPIYLGWMLMVWATPFLTPDRFWFAVLSTAYLIVAIPIEERGLVAQFGADYAAYRRRVRWRVLPGIY